MCGVQRSISVPYWPLKTTTPSLFSHTSAPRGFSFLLLFLDIRVRTRRSFSEDLCFFCQHQFTHWLWAHGWPDGCFHTLHTWYWWEDEEGGLGVKDACYIIARAIFQPPSSGGHVTSVDKLFLRWNKIRRTPHSGLRVSEWFVSPPVFQLERCPVTWHCRICSGHDSLFRALAVSEI